MVYLVRMRTTVDLDQELIEEARGLTGIQERDALIREALVALIARESARRIARLGGGDHGAKASRRRPVPLEEIDAVRIRGEHPLTQSVIDHARRPAGRRRS
jgi:Arc/MetJ family transcription regulator